MLKDYYNILGVDKYATEDEIKKAYKALALIFHPDKKAGNPHATDEHMKEINEAYGILSDPMSRMEYDRQFAAASAPPPSHLSSAFAGGLAAFGVMAFVGAVVAVASVVVVASYAFAGDNEEEEDDEENGNNNTKRK